VLRRPYTRLHALTLLSAALVASMACIAFLVRSQACAAPAGGGAPSRDAGILGAPHSMRIPGVLEPSGVAYHAASGRLYVVGDEGTLAELRGDGSVVWLQQGLGNLEDVAVHTPSGQLVLLSEKSSRLFLYDPARRAVLKQWHLDRKALLGQAGGAANQGFEGLAFRAEPGRPGGGTFFLTHQDRPSLLLEIAFDPARPAGSLGRESLIARHTLGRYTDLSAVSYSGALDRLLVSADSRNRLLVARTDGTLEASVFLPGAQQEGLALDGEGRLWVADDRGVILRFDAALSALQQQLGRERR
jgi:uncharacterized protein YjiK